MTGDASAIATSTATSPARPTRGAAINAHIEFGTTTGYGSRTADAGSGRPRGPTRSPPTSPACRRATLIHYRAVASTDFGTVAGADRTFVTASPTPTPTPQPAPHGHLSIGGGTLHLSHGAVKVKLTCPAGPTCRGTVKLRAKGTTLGSARFAVAGGHSKKVTVHLNRTALKRLRKAHRLNVRISAGGRTRAAVIKR